ncbi:SHOCT domain-containing protein [Halopiger xanaduensis]|uniref:SHOCT domain-containing protein n=1 Tax=Halopiger xanaduensis TaxID=387343 RepID=UPI000AC4FEA3
MAPDRGRHVRARESRRRRGTRGARGRDHDRRLVSVGAGVPLLGEEIAEWAFTEREPERAKQGRDEDAIEELKRRYAAGEIDDAEFERRLDRLVAVDDALAGIFDDGDGGTDRSTDGETGRLDRRSDDETPSATETEETYDRA